MVPILKGQAAPENWRTAQFYNYWSGPQHYGIRTDRYTYLKIENRSAELFDRKSDPEQIRNVADDPAYQSAITMLETELQQQIDAIEIRKEDLPGNRRQKKRGKRSAK